MFSNTSNLIHSRLTNHATIKKSPENKQTNQRKTTNKTPTNPQKHPTNKNKQTNKTHQKCQKQKYQKQKSQTQPKTNKLTDVIYILPK